MAGNTEVKGGQILIAKSRKLEMTPFNFFYNYRMQLVKDIRNKMSPAFTKGWIFIALVSLDL